VAIWIRPRRFTFSRASALENRLHAVREMLGAENWGGSVALLSNYAGVFADGERLRALFGTDRTALLGPEWLSARVDQSPSLRRAMPSLLSLGDLGRWLPAGVRERSTLDIGAARALAEVFVPTDAHRRALKVLDAHHFAVLTGPPEMGKTSIARMIALALMSNGWGAFECTAPEEIYRAFETTRSQVFVADDAFGSTEYRPDAGERWAREMERLLRMMDDRHFLIWTSRPAPLRAGLRRIHRERGAERFPQPGEVLVDASKLTLEEKVLILLRHAKASVPGELRRHFREAGYAIVSHRHFTPERIRRLVSTDAEMLPREGGARFEALIDWHIQTPTRAMRASFNALSDEHRDLLIAMLDAPPGHVEERELARLARLHHPAGLSRAPMELVDRLTDHFLRVSDTLKVEWVHPSWRDLVIDHLRENAKTRGAFLETCTLQGILLAISGAGGPAGARTLALLLTDHDWDIVTDRIVRMAGTASEPEVVRVLDALAATVEETRDAKGRDRDELAALIRATLPATARRCDGQDALIDVELIGAWLRLSREIPEAPPLPCLDRAWAEYLPGTMVDLAVPANLDAAIKWLELGELLGEHAPQEAKRYGFPEQHRDRIYALVNQAHQLLSAQDASIPRERLTHLVRLCRGAGVHRPEQVTELDELIWQASREPDPEPPIATAALPEASIRLHVELILEDL
jgi:hypothetical protein